MKTILVPVDFSSVTESVIKESVALARALEARIILLHITQPPILTADYAPLMENIAEIVAASEKAAAQHLAQLQERLAVQGLPTETVQLNGAPVALIAEQAAKFAADYVVMGSHGHTAFYDLLVGSTTHGVLLKTSCPVVIVPAPKSTAKARPAP